MPIAKETLTIGFTVAALPGNFVSSEAVEQHGWHDKVEPDPEPSAVEAEQAGADEATSSRKRKTS